MLYKFVEENLEKPDEVILWRYLNDLIENIGDQCYTIKELTREV